MSNAKLLAHRIVAQNRKARYDYFVVETIEAGIMLQGSEVKSLREGKASIVDAHAQEQGGEIWLLNSYIPEYKGANRFNHEPRRPRKLLLHRKQINKMLGKLKLSGMTVVALSIYFNEHNKAKVELALVKGKKAHDKRESEKERDWDREKGRIMREQGKEE